MCIFDGFCFRVSRVLQKVIQLGCSLSGGRDGESDEDHPRETQPLVQAMLHTITSFAHAVFLAASSFRSSTAARADGAPL